MITTQLAEQARGSFSSAFFNALVEAITEASETPWLVAAVPDAGSPAEESEPICINFILDGSLQGEFLLQFRRAEAAILASKCLRQPLAEFATEQSDALLKLAEVAINRFRSGVAEEYGV